MGHTHTYTWAAHAHKYTFMPSKASQKCYDPHPSMIVRSCIGGLLLHPFACLNILAWLCIIQAEGNNHQYSFCNRKPVTMKWNQKWNTGFISNVGLLYVIFSRKRELVREKAAAGYRGLIWRRSPADLSWPGRHCPWLKGSSTLEVFGIDCSKLHHKPPLKGNVFTVSPNEGWQGRLTRWLGTIGMWNLLPAPGKPAPSPCTPASSSISSSRE